MWPSVRPMPMRRSIVYVVPPARRRNLTFSTPVRFFASPVAYTSNTLQATLYLPEFLRLYNPVQDLMDFKWMKATKKIETVQKDKNKNRDIEGGQGKNRDHGNMISIYSPSISISTRIPILSRELYSH